MMKHLQENEIHSIADLVEYYHHVNWNQSLYVGIEWERSGIFRDDQTPVPYLGENGYNAILHKLVEEVGWEIISENEEIRVLPSKVTDVWSWRDHRKKIYIILPENCVFITMKLLRWEMFLELVGSLLDNSRSMKMQKSPCLKKNDMTFFKISVTQK